MSAAPVIPAPSRRPKVLLLGSGSSRDRRLRIGNDPPGTDWKHVELVTLDRNPAHRPTVVHDLSVFPWPFEDNAFDRVDAYEILEHLGQQGDAAAFFRDFSEIWRILKPGGFLGATCPSWRSIWAWGDPSHRRVLCSGSLVFLDQNEYTRQVGKTAMSDFRDIYQADFAGVHVEEDNDKFTFVLAAIKPSRLTAPAGGA